MTPGSLAPGSRGALLSVIVPAYNERTTVTTLLDQVLAADLAALGLRREVVIVESNSTDGTRELVARYEGNPEVRIVWEAAPRGKGHAVRSGLAVATGDIVLVQDADLEYSVDDYPDVLRPILEGRADFVLGSRHGGNSRIRTFENQPVAAAFLNLGHVLFAGLVNLLCGTRLKDPFTMYKVFRRTCLAGLHLTRNGFDFDFEIVIKLVRKGYRPLEVPVSYRSRSFAAGKKVRVWRDPWTWLLAAVWSRFEPL